MPIQTDATICRMNQRVFGEIAHKVMRSVFQIHNEFGRFFDEKIYKRELRRRIPQMQLEVPISVSFGDFRKDYFIDALVEGGAVFEFKTVETLAARHRSQLLHYLLLADLSHGKLVNLRPLQVQHAFVNTRLRSQDRKHFTVHSTEWEERGGLPLKDWLVSFLREIGTALDRGLYEEAVTHFLGGEEKALREIQIVSGDALLGPQKFRMVEFDTALKITMLEEASSLFETHIHRLLNHTSLQAVQWINIARNDVTFRTLKKARGTRNSGT